MFFFMTGLQNGWRILWEFKLATLNGKPVEVYLVLTVHFRLEEY